MKAYRIYTTVFVVNDAGWLVISVEWPHVEGARSDMERLNREFAYNRG